MNKQRFFVSFQTGEGSGFDIPPNFKTKAEAIAFGKASGKRFAVFCNNVCVFEG